ncbi:MAG TPA: hypothetical protein VEC99_08385 [Clostridia bacterium]|nr:hypothetical protein [Clostridia bacterium]
MKEFDPEVFEAELQQLRPAKPPQEFLDRLAKTAPMPQTSKPVGPSAWACVIAWWRTVRWWAPLGAAAALAVFLAVRHTPTPAPQPPAQPLVASVEPALHADDVEINQQLIAAFDAVAELPTGEPVRFRCREYVEDVVLRDSARGVEIQRRTPRLEIVPISFETY